MALAHLLREVLLRARRLLHGFGCALNVERALRQNLSLVLQVCLQSTHGVLRQLGFADCPRVHLLLLLALLPELLGRGGVQ